MTFREKLLAEHPEKKPLKITKIGCPEDYGYEEKRPCWSKDNGRDYDPCWKCWNRPMLETNLVIGDSKVEHPDTDIPEKMEEQVLQYNRTVDDESKTIYCHVGPFGQFIEESSTIIQSAQPGKPDLELKVERKILDSGNRRQFESGAVRDIQEGKGRCDLLPLDVVAAIYTAFFPEDPDLGDVMTHISAFMATGEVTPLYQALDNFVHKQFKQTWSEMFLQVAIHFEEGAKKYGENNWRKGIPVHCYIDSAVRHYLKFLRGDKDEPHDRAFAWNIMCAIWTCKHKPELNEYAVKEEVQK